MNIVSVTYTYADKSLMFAYDKKKFSTWTMQIHNLFESLLILHVFITVYIRFLKKQPDT